MLIPFHLRGVQDVCLMGRGDALNKSAEFSALLRFCVGGVIVGVRADKIFIPSLS